MSEAVVGSVAIEVVPSAENFARKLRQTLLPDIDRIGTEAGRALSDRIQAAMGDIKVRVDISGAQADIDLIRENLRRLGSEDARIKVSVDTALARAELDRLRAELARLGASTTTHTVRINQVGSGGSGGGGGLGMGVGLSLLPALIPMAAAAVPLIGGIGAALVGAAAGGAVLKMAFTGVGDAVTALGAKTGQSGQQLKQQAAQQLSAANGILNAQDAVANSVRALQNAQKQAGQQAVQSAESVRNAEQSLADARRSAATSVAGAEQALADARRSAALSVTNAEHGVTAAEQSLTAAQYTETQAQKSLTDARRQAAQTLQDLSNQVKDGALSQRQATLDLQAARDNLTLVDFNPHSTAQQRAEAQLQFDQAKQRLSEIGLANTRLAAQKAAADKAGVSGAQSVLQAEHSLGDATRARKDAQDGVARSQAAVVEAQRAGSEQIAKAVAAETEARRAGAEQIAKAQQGVSDAIRQQAQQADSSQQAILSAQQGIVSSQRALSQAYASAGAQGSSANDKVAESMAALTPAGQRFARFIADKLKPALKTLTDSAQQNFLPGFQTAIQTLLPFMPGFAKFVGAIARELGNMAQAAANGLSSPFWKQFGTFLGDMAKSALPTLGTILGNLATGFAGLFEAIAPAGNGVGGGLVNISKAFADWATHLGTNKGFQGFLQYVKDNSPAVGKFFKDLAEIIGKLVTGLAPQGSGMLGLIEKIVGFLSGLSPSQLALLFQIGTAFLLVSKVAGNLGGAVGGVVNFGKAVKDLGPAFKFAMSPMGLIIIGIALLVAGLVYAYFHFKTFREVVDTVAKAVAAAFTWLWERVLHPTLNWIVDHWHYVVTAMKAAWNDVLHPVLDALAAAARWLWSDVLKPTFSWIGDHWHLVVTAMKAAWFDVLHPVFDGLAAAVRWVWERVVDPVFTYIKDHWHDVTSAMNITYTKVLKPVWDAMTGAFSSVGTAFGKFRDGLSTVWGEIKGIFIGGVNFVTQNILNSFIDAINAVTGVFKIKPIDHLPKISTDTSVATGANSTGQPHQGPGGRVPTKAAHGLVVPGYAPGVDNFAAILSPGEGVLVPEAVRGLGGPDFVHAANRHFSNRLPANDNRHFFGGGVVRDVASAAGTGFKSAARLAESAATLGPRLALDAAELPLKAAMGRLSPEIIKTLAQGAFGFIDKAVRAFIGHHSSSGSGSSAVAAQGAAAGTNAAAAQAYAASQLGRFGWGGDQMSPLILLWNHESGWNYAASNGGGGPDSGRAYGIPQSLPGNKMAASGADWRTNPATQINWGLNYIKGRYGSPGAAWAFEMSHTPNWYDKGGVASGKGLMAKNILEPERVLSPRQTDLFDRLVVAMERPRPVLNDAQWAEISAAADRGGPARPPIQQTNHFYEQTDPQQAAAESARRLHLASLI